MSCEIEYTDEFGIWWDSLSALEQASIEAVIQLLEEHGAYLTFPHCSGVNQSRFNHMRELRIQHQGKPYRVLYIFNPKRDAILLLGGDKTGQDRWYEVHIPIADRLYEAHLEKLDQEKDKGEGKDG
ncbi:MAG: type II toxin-antitoxin system RelE/ParE family toxin [Pseudomonadota bacterium]|nr:type II toxin-antitoxin system RelE/ParE family toxin [Pseudomonadota bacterium]